MGEDIPAGVYQVYPATLVEGDFDVYETADSDDRTSHINIEVTGEVTHETVQLYDGNKVELDTDVIMRKQPKLNFD